MNLPLFIAAVVVPVATGSLSLAGAKFFYDHARRADRYRSYPIAFLYMFMTMFFLISFTMHVTYLTLTALITLFPGR